MIKDISDTFGIWTCGTCTCDFGVENNLLMEVIFYVENN